MNRITAILEAHPDGTVHLPVPAELRRGKVEVTATLRAAPDADSGDPSILPSSLPRATPEMLQRRKEAFAALRAMGGLNDVISDPAAWQREMRQDRPLPGRD
jgi:hypothetical protein